MKTFFTAFFFFLYLGLLAQADSVCAVKIGGSFYINCKSIITFQKTNVLSVSGKAENTIPVNFSIFNSTGQQIGEVSEGSLKAGSQDDFSLKVTANEFTLIEKASSRIICHVKKVPGGTRCELWVWVDMYLPNGTYLQCTPESSEHPTLQMVKGATFKNSLSAIHLN